MTPEEQETCANCGKIYGQHLKGPYCRIGSDQKWFPQNLADAIVEATQKIAEPDAAKRIDGEGL